MNVWQRSIVDEAGNVVPSASVEVRDEVTSNLVQLYSDYDGASPIGNPIAADGNGFVQFYADTGRYQITATSGAFSKVWDNEIFGLPSVNIRYDRTPAEITAGVTPVNKQYLPGDPFRQMNFLEVADVVSLAATMDVSAPIMEADSVGIALDFQEGRYLVEESLIITSRKNFYWKGVPRKTVLVNKASANKPTLKLTDVLYGRIEGIVWSGRAGFPNMGVLIDATFSGANGNFEFIDNSWETNGIGIEARMINTALFENPEYWPTNGLGVGSSEEVGGGTRKHWLFVDETFTVGGEDNYFNDIIIRRPNIIGVDRSISGHANIKIGCQVSGGIQRVTIENAETEGETIGVGRNRLDLKNILNLSINGLYQDDADLLLTGCRTGMIENVYNVRVITLVDCYGIKFRECAQGDVGSDVTLNAGCIDCGFENFDFLVAPTDAGTRTTYKDWFISGARQQDRIAPTGFCERGRTLANGESAMPAFSAGDYTGTVGTWTVASGDRIDMSHTPLAGKRVQVDFDLRTTTTSGGVTVLNIAMPGSYTAGTKDKWFTYAWSDATTHDTGVGQVVANGSTIKLYRDINSTAFANVTDLLVARGSFVFETQ